MAGTDLAVSRGVKEIGLEHLHLHRNGQAVLGTTGPAPDQDLTAFDHLSADQRLQAIDIELPVGIAIAGPGFPEFVDRPVEPVVARCRARHDAGADDVVDQHRHRLGGMRIVAHQIAHAISEQRPRSSA